MKTLLSRSWLLALLLAGLAMSADPADAQSRTRKDPNRITAEELTEDKHGDLYDAVRRLRPAWLRLRGTGSISRPEDVPIYYDGARYGGSHALRSLDPLGVAELVYLDGPTATMRYGTGHTNGAILVVSMSGTRRGG